MKTEKITQTLSQPAVLLGLFVLLLSYLTYFQNYAYPSELFWDENYHLASAQKYLNGIYFMEPHPPLGKLMIALGEKLLQTNEENNQFLDSDYSNKKPDVFSFGGYRLFPTLLAWLAAPLLYLTFLIITKNPQYATVFSFLYVFDNALIVHSRGAMLDSTLVFFCVLTILAFFLLLEYHKRPKAFIASSLLFGAAFGAVMTTKETGLILALFIPALMWKLWPDTSAIGKFLTLGLVSFLLTFCGVWYIHFALGSTVNPKLPDDGYYQASPAYKQILDEGRNRSLLSFPTMLRDSILFMGHYARGVPRLDMCKEDENGSPFFYWPLGARSISYRWETPDGHEYRYLYLQVNPVVWWVSFAAVLVGAALLLASVLLPLKESLHYRFPLTVFILMYACYMLAIARLTRVMYLYHYFPPLLLSFIIVALVSLELKSIGKWHFTEQGRRLSLLAFGLLIFIAFQFYRPLTYYQPLTDEQFKRRAIFPPWELKCVNCKVRSLFGVPCRPS
jgi:dolichyl-phosphate-mannose--protein O-mannosyl transferase